MTILAAIPQDGKTIEVEVESIFTGGGGSKLASVRALRGRPFQAWTHGGWADSDCANVPVALLRDVRQVQAQPGQVADEPKAESLLDLALAQAKPQWYSGEVVYLLTGKSGRPLAWLKNERATVWLLATGATRGLPVYQLQPTGWELAANLERKYQAWAAEARANIERGG